MELHVENEVGRRKTLIDILNEEYDRATRLFSDTTRSTGTLIQTVESEAQIHPFISEEFRILQDELDQNETTKNTGDKIKDAREVQTALKDKRPGREIEVLKPGEIQHEIDRVDGAREIIQRLIAALKRAEQINRELRDEVERQRRQLEEKDRMLEIYREILREIARLQREAEAEARRTNPPRINPPAPTDDGDRTRREGNPPVTPTTEPEIEEGKEIRVPGPYYEPDKHSKSKNDRIDRNKARELLGPEMKHIEDFIARPDVQVILDSTAPAGETPDQRKQRAFKAIRNRIQVRGLFQPTDPLLLLINADKVNFPVGQDEPHLQAAYALCWNAAEESLQNIYEQATKDANLDALTANTIRTAGSWHLGGSVDMIDAGTGKRIKLANKDFYAEALLVEHLKKTVKYRQPDGTERTYEQLLSEKEQMRYGAKGTPEWFTISREIRDLQLRMHQEILFALEHRSIVAPQRDTATARLQQEISKLLTLPNPVEFLVDSYINDPNKKFTDKNSTKQILLATFPAAEHNLFLEYAHEGVDFMNRKLLRATLYGLSKDKLPPRFIPKFTLHKDDGTLRIDIEEMEQAAAPSQPTREPLKSKKDGNEDDDEEDYVKKDLPEALTPAPTGEQPAAVVQPPTPNPAPPAAETPPIQLPKELDLAVVGLHHHLVDQVNEVAQEYRAYRQTDKIEQQKRSGVARWFFEKADKNRQNHKTLAAIQTGLGGLAFTITNPFYSLQESYISKPRDRHFARNVVAELKQGIGKDVPIHITAEQLTDAITRGKDARDKGIWQKAKDVGRNLVSGTLGIWLNSDQMAALDFIRSDRGEHPSAEAIKWKRDILNASLPEQAAIGQRFTLEHGASEEANEKRQELSITDETAKPGIQSAIKELITAYHSAPTGTRNADFTRKFQIVVTDLIKPVVADNQKQFLNEAELASNFLLLAQQVEKNWDAWQKPKEGSGKTALEDLNINLIVGSGEWGGARGRTAEKHMLGGWLDTKTDALEYRQAQAFLQQKEKSSKQISEMATAEFFAEVRDLTTSPLVPYIFGFLAEVAVTLPGASTGAVSGVVKGLSFPVGLGLSTLFSGVREYHELGVEREKVSRDLARGREATALTPRRRELQEVIVPMKTVNEIAAPVLAFMKRETNGSWSIKPELSPEDKKKLLLHAAHLKARLALSDASRGKKTSTNLIQYSEGQESAQYAELRGLLNIVHMGMAGVENYSEKLTEHTAAITALLQDGMEKALEVTKETGFQQILTENNISISNKQTLNALGKDFEGLRLRKAVIKGLGTFGAGLAGKFLVAPALSKLAEVTGLAHVVNTGARPEFIGSNKVGPVTLNAANQDPSHKFKLAEWGDAGSNKASVIEITDKEKTILYFDEKGNAFTSDPSDNLVRVAPDKVKEVLGAAFKETHLVHSTVPEFIPNGSKVFAISGPDESEVQTTIPSNSEWVKDPAGKGWDLVETVSGSKKVLMNDVQVAGNQLIYDPDNKTGLISKFRALKDGAVPTPESKPSGSSENALDKLAGIAKSVSRRWYDHNEPNNPTGTPKDLEMYANYDGQSKVTFDIAGMKDRYETLPNTDSINVQEAIAAHKTVFTFEIMTKDGPKFILLQDGSDGAWDGKATLDFESDKKIELFNPDGTPLSTTMTMKDFANAVVDRDKLNTLWSGLSTSTNELDRSIYQSGSLSTEWIAMMKENQGATDAEAWKTIFRPTHIEGGVMKDGMVRAVGTITNTEYKPVIITPPSIPSFKIEVTPNDPQTVTEWVLTPPEYKPETGSATMLDWVGLAPGRMNLEQGVLKEEAQRDFEPRTYTRLDHTALAPTRPRRDDARPSAAATSTPSATSTTPTTHPERTHTPAPVQNLHNARRIHYPGEEPAFVPVAKVNVGPDGQPKVEIHEEHLQENLKQFAGEFRKDHPDATPDEIVTAFIEVEANEAVKRAHSEIQAAVRGENDLQSGGLTTIAKLIEAYKYYDRPRRVYADAKMQDNEQKKVKESREKLIDNLIQIELTYVMPGILGNALNDKHATEDLEFASELVKYTLNENDASFQGLRIPFVLLLGRYGLSTSGLTLEKYLKIRKQSFSNTNLTFDTDSKKWSATNITPLPDIQQNVAKKVKDATKTALENHRTKLLQFAAELSTPRSPEALPNLEDSNVFYVPKARIIPDYHGGTEDTSLETNALDLFVKDAAPDELLINLGDVADRGPRSWEAIERTMRLMDENRLVYVFGNHDLLLLAAMSGSSTAFRNWIVNGGLKTIKGAGVDISELEEVFAPIVEAEFNLRLSSLSAKFSMDPYNMRILRNNTTMDILEKIIDKEPTEVINKIINELFAKTLQNTNLLKWKRHLLEKAKTYVVANESLIVHAGMVVDKDTKAPHVLKDIIINNINYGSGIVALKKIQDEIRKGDKTFLTLLAVGLSHDEHPFWIRKPFYNAMNDSIVAKRLRDELNSQVAVDRTNIEFIVVGHDAEDSVRQFGGTRPLGPTNTIPRMAIIDTGFYLSEMARLIKLRVPASDPQSCTVMCEDPRIDPRLGNKVDIGDRGLGFPYKMSRKVESAPVAEAKSPPAETEESGELIQAYETVYTRGNNLYDWSTSVNDKDGNFMGEVGFVIGHAFDRKEPNDDKPVSTIEAWLFDKSDIRTVTKVLMSEWTFNDPATKTMLARKGDPILIKKGEVIEIETSTLITRAKIADISYDNSSDFPKNSVIQNIKFEVAVSRKSAAVASA